MKQCEITLSIGIPTYNRGERVCKVINNILKYPYSDIEIVVCDNCSDDSTWELINNISDVRLRVYKNDRNYGFTYNSMRTLFLTSGKYVMLLNDRDNIILEKLYEFIQTIKEKEYDIICAKNAIERYDFKILRNRARMIYQTSHPGERIYSRLLLKRVFDRQKKKEVDCFDAIKVGYILIDEIYNSKEWFCYSGGCIITKPEGEEYIALKKTREEQDSNPFWTTRGRSAQTLRILLNQEIAESNREEWIKGIYKEGMRYCLRNYYSNIKSDYICRRYGFVPPQHIFWLYEALLYRTLVCKGLKKDYYFSFRISVYISIVTLCEYLVFLKVRIVDLKKRVLG